MIGTDLDLDRIQIQYRIKLFQRPVLPSRPYWLSFASGLSEPLGALIGWALLSQFLNDTVFGIVFAAVAGVMVFISLDELLPTAEKYGEHHHAIYGVIAGMAVMALSLLLFL